MNVIALASRKGGAGKSTLAAHLAAHVHLRVRPCLLIDDDPQGSLTLWNDMRQGAALPMKIVKRRIPDILQKAERQGIGWTFIDTPANVSASVIEAMEAATLVVVPCRPNLFDLDAVQDTIELARCARTPYFVVLNGAAPKRDKLESRTVTSARECLAQLGVPVWGGQITHRTSFALSLARGEGVEEYDADPCSVTEISRLWEAIKKSTELINESRKRTPTGRFVIFPALESA